MRVTDCGHGVWLGDRFACNEKHGEFDRIIHIWREASFDEHTCLFVKNHQRIQAKDFVMRFYEHGSFGQGDRPIPDIAAFAAVPGKLLVHCAGGAVRSSTVAVLAKAARGCDPFLALADVARAMRQPDYMGHLFNNVGLTEIFDWRAAA
jgi:protein-tyrosine phosphatase